MNLESYAMFLVGTILVSTSIIVIGLMLLFLNFIFTKYWRPVNFGYWAPFWVTDFVIKTSGPRRFMTEEEFAEYQKQLNTLDRDAPPKSDHKLDLNKF